LLSVEEEQKLIGAWVAPDDISPSRLF
jgi:hypothetical protein